LSVGELKTLDNQIDTTTGTVKLRALFANEDDNLFPNQFVNIQLLVDVVHEATIIPTSAVQRGAPGTFVYLVDAGSTVSVKPIDLGPSSGERVAVRSGLSPGDRVVIDGADRLRNGAKVAIRDGPAGVAAAALSSPPSAAAAPPSAPGAAPAPPSEPAAGAAQRRGGGSRRSRDTP
jgi:multidrug efflux system membrane fusion protein